MSRIAIVGSRRLPRDRARRVIFNGVAGTATDTTIVSGGARGPKGFGGTVSADREAARAARFYRRTLDEMEADWDGLGKRAGYVRNAEIVDSLRGDADRLVAIWDGSSPGTRNVIALAEAAGRLGRVVTLESASGDHAIAAGGPSTCQEKCEQGTSNHD